MTYAAEAQLPVPLAFAPAPRKASWHHALLRALLYGRTHVQCEDIQALALPVLRHRILTNFTAASEGWTSDRVIEKMLRDTDELASRMDAPENQERMSDERQQLEQTREQVRRASEALENEQF